MSDQLYLDLNYIPHYEALSFREFRPGEHHSTRVSEKNILLIVIDGVLRFEEDGKPTELHRGEYYIQTAGKTQSGVAVSDEPKYYYINFQGKYTDKRERSLPLRGTFDVDKMCELCNKIYHDEHFPDAHVSIFQRQIVFFDILNTLYRGNISFVERQELAVQIAQYIDAHYAEPLTLETVSEHFSYSKDHIIRVFKGEYKITPYQYLVSKRICYAKLLLTTSDMTVAGIAAACGFNDISAFYYAFDKAVGCAPGDYRRDGAPSPKEKESEE